MCCLHITTNILYLLYRLHLTKIQYLSTKHLTILHLKLQGLLLNNYFT